MSHYLVYKEFSEINMFHPDTAVNSMAWVLYRPQLPISCLISSLSALPAFDLKNNVIMSETRVTISFFHLDLGKQRLKMM